MDVVDAPQTEQRVRPVRALGEPAGAPRWIARLSSCPGFRSRHTLELPRLRGRLVAIFISNRPPYAVERSWRSRRFRGMGRRLPLHWHRQRSRPAPFAGIRYDRGALVRRRGSTGGPCAARRRRRERSSRVGPSRIAGRTGALLALCKKGRASPVRAGHVYLRLSGPRERVRGIMRRPTRMVSQAGYGAT